MLPKGSVQVLALEHVNVAESVRAAAEILRSHGISVRSCGTLTEFESALRQHPDAAVLLVSNAFRCDASVLAALPSLRGVVYIASGTESIDLAEASRRGIAVAHGRVPEVWESMAEATVLLILAALYQLPRSMQLMNASGAHPLPYARMLKGKTVGLVGFGAIARGVATRLANWSVALMTSAPRLDVRSLPANVRAVDLDELLETSDVVCLLASVNAENRGLLNERRLAQMKRGAVIVNTARGALIDEPALLRAVEAGNIGFVALDTFATEPLPRASGLRTLDNAILTPHAVGHTVETFQSLVDVAAENVERLLRGELPVFLRNPEVIGRPLRPLP